nr:hypothetical protein [Lachnospiraceae bacterium]
MESYYGRICNYCGKPLKENDEVIICPACKKSHHVACWIAREGCSTEGCSEQSPVLKQQNEEKKKREIQQEQREWYAKQLEEVKAQYRKKTTKLVLIMLGIMVALSIAGALLMLHLLNKKDRAAEPAAVTTTAAPETQIAPVTTPGQQGETAAPETEPATEAPTTEAPTEAPTTEAPTEAAEESSWSLEHYVDSFGDETDETYVLGVFVGTYKDSATAESMAGIRILLNNHNSLVRFYLYKGLTQETLLSSDEVTLEIKTADGKVKKLDVDYLDGYFFSYTDGELKSLIMNNSQLSWAITISSRYSSVDDVFRFKTDNIGLKELLGK